MPAKLKKLLWHGGPREGTERLWTIYRSLYRWKLPGCQSAEQVMDIWTHPLLSDRWGDVLQEVKLLTSPAMMIISGASGPIHTQRPLAIITLGSPGGRLSPMVFNWKPTLFDYNNINTLVIDVPEGHRWKTFKLLGKLKIPGLVHIDSPKPSAGNSKTDPRSAIHCHFGVGSSLSIEKEMLRKWVHTQLSPFHALVGFAELVRDPRSMLLDISHTSAAVLYADLCSGMLVISPKLLVVCTRAEDGVWKQSLTESWKADPNTTCE